MLRISRSRRISHLKHVLCHLCTDSPNNGSDKIELPPEPTTCCMSGCPNCVWIEYANELSEKFADGGDKARKLILEKVSDPNMRAFLDMELRYLQSRPK